MGVLFKAVPRDGCRQYTVDTSRSCMEIVQRPKLSRCFSYSPCQNAYHLNKSTQALCFAVTNSVFELLIFLPLILILPIKRSCEHNSPYEQRSRGLNIRKTPALPNAEALVNNGAMVYLDVRGVWMFGSLPFVLERNVILNSSSLLGRTLSLRGDCRGRSSGYWDPFCVRAPN